MTNDTGALPRTATTSNSKFEIRNPKFEIITVALATLLGLYVRLAHIAPVDFPLNDGGLFYLMTQELQRAHYALPDFTSYNQGNIPFAYPPLPFYIAGLLSDLTGWPLLDIVRLLPPVTSALIIPAVYLLAGALLRSRARGAIAAFAFAFVPNSFEWLMMGGGLTRAPALLFAVLALHQVYLLYTSPRKMHLFASILFGSLTALSHSEVAWFLIFSSLLLLLFHGRDRRGVVNSLLVAAGVVGLTSPWWATVISRHGLTPLISALSGGHHGLTTWIPLLQFRLTNEPLLELGAALGLLGLLASLVARKYLLPLWLVATMVLAPRTGSTYAMVPLAMLVSVSLTEVILPALLGLNRKNAPASEEPDTDAQSGLEPRTASMRWPSGLFANVVLAVLALYGVVSAWYFPVIFNNLHALSVEERQAMQWISANTPESSKFWVVTNFVAAEDATTEWFPVLTRRVSLATEKGFEWLPGEFNRREKLFYSLQACAKEDAACLERLAQSSQATYTHVYVRKRRGDLEATCCPALAYSLMQAPDYALVYDGPGAMIFALRTANTSTHTPTGTDLLRL